jgi:hypothetical protein
MAESTVDRPKPLYLVNEPCQARAFGDEVQHGTEMKQVVLYRPIGSKAKLEHGSVAFKRVVPSLWPIGPYRAEPARIPDIQNMFIFLIYLVILIKNYLISLNLN